MEAEVKVEAEPRRWRDDCEDKEEMMEGWWRQDDAAGRMDRWMMHGWWIDDAWRMDGALTEGLCRRQFQSWSGLRRGRGEEKEKWAGPQAERRSAPDFQQEEKREAGGEKEEPSGRSGKIFRIYLFPIITGVNKLQPGGDIQPVTLSNPPCWIGRHDINSQSITLSLFQ